MESSNIEQQEWGINSLNKAYRQGYTFGLSGENIEKCPYKSEVIASTWEAGWHDGRDQASVTQQVPMDTAIA